LFNPKFISNFIFTELPSRNDVADFTPYGARARKEIHTYEAFFSGKGDPVVLFVLITAKRPEGNMLGVHELEEAVEVGESQLFKGNNSHGKLALILHVGFGLELTN
jgi:hypothetical protein